MRGQKIKLNKQIKYILYMDLTAMLAAILDLACLDNLNFIYEKILSLDICI